MVDRPILRPPWRAAWESERSSPQVQIKNMVDGGAEPFWSVSVVLVCKGIADLVETASLSLNQCNFHLRNTFPHSLIILIRPNVLKVNPKIKLS
jgi:hypothetical protein